MELHLFFALTHQCSATRTDNLTKQLKILNLLAYYKIKDPLLVFKSVFGCSQTTIYFCAVPVDNLSKVLLGLFFKWGLPGCKSLVKFRMEWFDQSEGDSPNSFLAVF